MVEDLRGQLNVVLAEEDWSDAAKVQGSILALLDVLKRGKSEMDQDQFLREARQRAMVKTDSNPVVQASTESTVRQCPLRSGASGWGPAVPTAIWSSVAAEVRQCPLPSGTRGCPAVPAGRSGAGPAAPTAIWSSLELADEARQCPLRPGAGKEEREEKEEEEEEKAAGS
eukprot:s1775_g8.t1